MNQQQESERFLELAFADYDAALALSQIKEIKPHIIVSMLNKP